MMCRAHVTVRGRVQGVAFRYFTKEKANSLGVKGWVRNLPDGRVECELEGRVDAVKSLIDLLREGPRLAKVTGLDVEWLEYSGRYNDFRIVF